VANNNNNNNNNDNTSRPSTAPLIAMPHDKVKYARKTHKDTDNLSRYA
jgi:hypothetical protein